MPIAHCPELGERPIPFPPRTFLRSTYDRQGVIPELSHDAELVIHALCGPVADEHARP